MRATRISLDPDHAREIHLVDTKSDWQRKRGRGVRLFAVVIGIVAIWIVAAQLIGG